MKGYKAMESDWTCRGFKYEIGKTYELPDGEKMKMCECGFHFCANPIDVFGYYPFENTVIAVIEAIGNIEQEGTKFVTDKIKIIREFTRKQLQALIVDGNRNSGHCNSGRCNSGDCNSGHYNSGDCNSGNRNSGNRNSGDCNSGHYNSGDCNSGDCNSGRCNSGHYNSGDCNSGNRNSGRCNSGDCNSGHYNSGDCNSGNRNSGIFNTDEPMMRAFNRATTITYSEFIKNLEYSFSDLLSRIVSNNLLDVDADRIRSLPNFDAEIFKQITGIELEDDGKEGA